MDLSSVLKISIQTKTVFSSISETDNVIFITGADTPTGLSAATHLSGGAFFVIGVADNSSKPCTRSKHWNHVLEAPGDAASQIAYLSKLRFLINTISTPLLILSQDSHVIASYELKHLLLGYRTYLPDDETLITLMDKTLFHQWAKENNVKTPISVIVSSDQELGAALQHSDYPLIIKPLVRTSTWERTFSDKKFITLKEKPDSAKCLPENLFKISPRYLVQEWIPGSDSDVYFVLLSFSDTGDLLYSLAGQKLLQWPPLGGSTAACRTINNPGLVGNAVSLCKAAGVTGIVSVEYKMNPISGAFYVTEPTIGRNDYQSGLSGSQWNATKALAHSHFGLQPTPTTRYKRRLWIDELSTARYIKKAPKVAILLALNVLSFRRVTLMIASQAGLRAFFYHLFQKNR